MQFYLSFIPKSKNNLAMHFSCWILFSTGKLPTASVCVLTGKLTDTCYFLQLSLSLCMCVRIFFHFYLALALSPKLHHRNYCNTVFKDNLILVFGKSVLLIKYSVATTATFVWGFEINHVRCLQPSRLDFCLLSFSTSFNSGQPGHCHSNQVTLMDSNTYLTANLLCRT